MSTSATDNRQPNSRSLIGYGAASVFCLVFALIYEHFSHGVFSYFMMLAFLIPLAGGIVHLACGRALASRFGSLSRQLLAGAVIWLTLGSLFEGVLQIYGTTNRLIAVFPVVGIAQLAAAAIGCIAPRKNK